MIAPLTLTSPVWFQVKNLSSRPLTCFGTIISSGQTQLVPGDLAHPQDSSWQALINALNAGTVELGFLDIGGLAERIVRIALVGSEGGGVVAGGAGNTFIPLSGYAISSVYAEVVAGIGAVDLDDVRYTTVAGWYIYVAGFVTVTPGAIGKVRVYETHRNDVATNPPTGTLIAEVEITSTTNQLVYSATWLTAAWPGAAGGKRTLEVRLYWSATPSSSILTVGGVSLVAQYPTG